MSEAEGHIITTTSLNVTNNYLDITDYGRQTHTQTHAHSIYLDFSINVFLLLNELYFFPHVIIELSYP